jgi:hypothetical protein
MATLLDGVSDNTVGTLTSITGPCVVWVTGTTDGAEVILQGSPSDSTAEVVPLDRSIVPQAVCQDRTGAALVDIPGTYYLRAIVSNAGESTDITVETTQ